MYLEYWPDTASAMHRQTVLLHLTPYNSNLRLKRLLDIVGALGLLVLSAPIWLAAMAFIKLTSPGPVLFKQTRLGRNRQPFTMWKLRTMAREASGQEEGLRQKTAGHGPFFKINNDTRVTRVGKFLRKFSIDELPQLINVLKGEMSLVGPRPIRDFEFQQFEEWKQLRRFSVLPGLTCIWQVSGRSNTSQVMRMQYDLQYARDGSLLLDIKILLKTIPAVLKADGAE